MSTYRPPADSLFALSPPGQESRTDARPLARRSDPATSHEAAREVAKHLSTMQARVLDYLRGHGGLTATELSTMVGDADPRKVNRRVSELIRDGRVVVGASRRCRITGATARTLWHFEEVTQ